MVSSFSIRVPCGWHSLNTLANDARTRQGGVGGGPRNPGPRRAARFYARSMASSDDWTRIGDSAFVSLGTYRKNGAVVATPVWIARDGDELVVTTERSTGKVKRLRNDPRVTLRPSSRMGRVAPDAIRVEGVARLDDDLRPANDALKAKYGWQFRAVLGFERLLRRLQRTNGERVIVRISRPPA
jgi:PPOX class probable F420-dependent enzyme